MHFGIFSQQSGNGGEDQAGGVAVHVIGEALFAIEEIHQENPVGIGVRTQDEPQEGSAFGLYGGQRGGDAPSDLFSEARFCFEDDDPRRWSCWHSLSVKGLIRPQPCGPRLGE